MRWPGYKHIFFDCDSTLTTVEGIDALAEAKGKGWRVSILTKAAMNGEIDLDEAYAKRLRLLKPTRGQVRAIRRIYKQNIVPDAAGVIAALQFLGHQVYILSGGLAEPVIEFGRFLGVPREHIRAVSLEYDQLSGNWWQVVDDERPNDSERFLAYTEDSLTISEGKAHIVNELLGDQLGRALLIGDGVSDLLAAEEVDLFVGFSGVVSRPLVQSEAPVSIKSLSLAPLLVLAAGPASLELLAGSEHQPLAERAKQLIEEGAIYFQNEELNDKFDKAWRSAY